MDSALRRLNLLQQKPEHRKTIRCNETATKQLSLLAIAEFAELADAVSHRLQDQADLLGNSLRLFYMCSAGMWITQTIRHPRTFCICSGV